MVYEEDYILRITRIMAVGVGQLFNKTALEQLELKEFQDQEGKNLPLSQLYTNLLSKQKYDLLFRLIHTLKFKLPLYQYEELVDYFILDLEKKTDLKDTQIEAYLKQLNTEDDFEFFV